MRVLPRTRRGIWTMAGVVWLAGAVVSWFVLSPQPLATWADPGETKLLGFRAGTRTLLAWTKLPADQGGEFQKRLIAWDAGSGRKHILYETTNEAFTPILSPDGQWAAVPERAATGHYRPKIVNTETGRVQPVASDLGQHGEDGRFTADSRLFVCRRDGCHLYDVMTGAERARVDPDRIGLHVRLAALTPDGSGFITTELERNGNDVANWPAFLRVRSISDKSIVKSIVLPLRCWEIDDRFTGLSPEGRYFAATYRTVIAGGVTRSGVRCWDLARGSHVYDMDAAEGIFPVGAPWFAVLSESSGEGRHSVSFIEYSTGREIGRAKAPTGWPDNGGRISVSRHAHFPNQAGADEPRALAPDARVLVEGRITRDAVGVVGDWLISHGIAWVPDISDVIQFRLLDPITGRSIATVTSTVRNWAFGPPETTFEYCFEGRSFALLDWDRLQVWDVPTRPPLSWWAAWAVTTGLIVAGSALRRVRKLRP